MFKIRANRLEEDVVTSAFFETYGDIGAAVRAFRFDDPRGGEFRATGGAIGRGGAMVDRYIATALTIELRGIDLIQYEKAWCGSASSISGDEIFTTRTGIATIAQQGDFDLTFRPNRRRLQGLSVALTLNALEKYLAKAGERQCGPVDARVVRPSGVAGLDSALLSLAEHILEDFDAYRLGAGTRRAMLGEALLTEVFVELLLSTGALTLRARVADFDDKSIRCAKEFIHANLGQPINSADIAAVAGTSLRRLQIGFRKSTGMTPGQYLRAARLDLARRLLFSGNYSSVTEVALECGITHFGRFSSEYKMRFGEKPSRTLRRNP